MSAVACDLCGSTAAKALGGVPAGRAMQSDRTIVPVTLAKVECTGCGLVRDADPHAIRPSYYSDVYQLDRGDHVFHSPTGPQRRSSVMADWIEELLAAGGVATAAADVLEVGASRGFLQLELASRWPTARIRGVELSLAAAGEATRRGADVHAGGTEHLPSGELDLVVAIAVLEHVPSPTEFLTELRRLLRPGGHLVLIQPTQAVPSYDIFFVDHLHHFGPPHLEAYARKTAFVPLHSAVGFRFMPNFSGHLLAAGAAGAVAAWQGPAATTSCAETLRTVSADLARAVQTAQALAATGARFGVFGLHEVFALVRAYSSLGELGIALGLADDAENPDYAALGFPILRPEDATTSGVRDIFLTMNRVHYPFATARLARLGLRAVPVLT
jgi:SAM-dependent methyltransferase